MPKKAKKMIVNCTFCGKELERPINKKTSENKNFFCTQSHFFSWRRQNHVVPWNYNKQGELVAELQRVANILGHLPTTKEMSEHGSIYPSTYEKRFGSWRMALSQISDPSPETTWDISQVSESDGGWLSGFSDGESVFRLAKHRTSFVCIWGFQLRADDIYAAEEAKRILGLQNRPLRWWSRDSDRARGIEAGDAVRFFVRDIPTHYAHVLPFFNRFPLRSKKKPEFDLFTKAVNLLFDHQASNFHKRYPDDLKKTLEGIKIELQEAKKYKHPSQIDDYLKSRQVADTRTMNRRHVFTK